LATIVAVVFAIVFYVWTTYSMAIGFGVNNGAAWAKDPTALATTAQVYSGHTLSILISIAAILSAFVVCLACANAAARTMFAMGREGTLPAVFGRTHPVYKTPVNAILGVTAVATVVAALIGFFWDYGGGPTTVYFLMASIGTIAIILVYMALCLGGVAFFRRLMRKWNPIVHAVLPAIGFIIFGLAVYGSIYPGALPPMPYRIVPYVNLGWLALGIVLLWYLRTNHPHRVSRIGSILGEEGGEEAGALDEAPSPSDVKPTEPTAGMANPD
jgi:amino acid transporter